MAERRTATAEAWSADGLEDTDLDSDAVAREVGLALLAQRRGALRQFVTAEPEKLHAERRIEDGAGCAQPVVERVFRPPDGVRRALRQPHRDLHRPRLNLLVRHRERNQADALGLLAADRLAQQQMVFGLGHA